MASRKRQLFEQLVYEVRRSQAATDRYDEAVADAIGLNRTDMRCLDVIQREGPVPAGRLAEETGLTTGAITTVLDRLERAGFARRTRDPATAAACSSSWRRRRAAGAGDYYGEHMALGERLFRRYSEEQLGLLLEFTREGRELNEREAAKLEARTRSQRES